MVIPAALLKTVTDAGEASYPDEACGLLVGRVSAEDVILVTGVEPAPNVAPARAARFEIDPRVRFALTRRLRGGAERVIGHYHSHPDLPASPSRRDLERAFEPDLVWVITSVQAGRAAETTASILDPAAKRFHRLALQVTG